MATKAKKSNKRAKTASKPIIKSVKAIKPAVKSAEAPKPALKKAVRRQGNNKVVMTIVGAVCMIVAVTAIVWVAVANNTKLDAGYFVSDGSKYVITMTAEEMGADSADAEAEGAPLSMHIVYEYSGDDVTAVRVYYKYANPDSAQDAYNARASEETESSEEVKLEGEYLILVAPQDSYEGMTVEDVQEQMDLIEKLKNGELSDLIVEEETEVVEE